MGNALFLVVDDDPDYRKVLKRMLNRMGYDNIMEAGSGHEAMAMAARYFPDIILMDVNIPYGNGIETTKTIVENFPELKVVMITGEGTPATVIDSIKAGAKNFLLKPFEMKQMEVVIRKAFRETRPDIDAEAF